MQIEIYKIAQNMKNLSVSFSSSSHNFYQVLYINAKMNITTEPYRVLFNIYAFV